jgi:hypothetical protein
MSGMGVLSLLTVDHVDTEWQLSVMERVIQKIYAPSSSLLQGKYLPFSPSPLRLNMFRLFVILSLTQLYRYGCIIPAHCRPCRHGMAIKCHGTCSLYALCNMGTYSFKRCLEGRQFDVATGVCVPGTCLEDEKTKSEIYIL